MYEPIYNVTSPPQKLRGEGVTIEGDIDAFFDYLESGGAAKDWDFLHNRAMELLAESVRRATQSTEGELRRSRQAGIWAPLG